MIIISETNISPCNIINYSNLIFVAKLQLSLIKKIKDAITTKKLVTN